MSLKHPHDLVGTREELERLHRTHAMARAWLAQPYGVVEDAIAQVPELAGPYARARDAAFSLADALLAEQQAKQEAKIGAESVTAQARAARGDEPTAYIDPNTGAVVVDVTAPPPGPGRDLDGGLTEWWRREVREGLALFNDTVGWALSTGVEEIGALALAGQELLRDFLAWLAQQFRTAMLGGLVLVALLGLLGLGALAIVAWSPLTPTVGGVVSNIVPTGLQAAQGGVTSVVTAQVDVARQIPALAREVPGILTAIPALLI